MSLKLRKNYKNSSFLFFGCFDSQNQKRKRILSSKYLFLAGLSGLLLVASFPYLKQPYLAWVSLVPLLAVVLSSSSLREAFLYGFVGGIIFFLGLSYWLLSLTVWVGFWAVLAWVSLSFVEALSCGLFALLVKVIHRQPQTPSVRTVSLTFLNYKSLIFVPALWVSLEFLRSLGPWAFPWGVLGYSQRDYLIMTQLASITGVYGVSFLVVLINVFLLQIWLFFTFKSSYKEENLKSQESVLRKNLVIAVVSLLIVFLFVLGWGTYSLYFRYQHWQKASFYNVAALQGNIPQREKWDFAKAEKIRSIYRMLTQKSQNNHPYLVIWPESALPTFYREEQSYLREISKTISKKTPKKKGSSYLLFGSLRRDRSTGNSFNSAFLMNSRGIVSQRYDKIFLVPFGEYIPLEFVFSFVRTIAGYGENISPGKKRTLFDTEAGKLGTVVCFESTNPGLNRAMVEDGAQLLVTVTNDAWFGRTAEAEQHLEMTSFRAIENGVYVVQVANTGVSAIIDPQGRFLKKTSLFEREIITGKVSFRSENRKTFYTRLGDLFAFFCLFLTAIGILKPSI